MRARLGLKAPARARLDRARAHLQPRPCSASGSGFRRKYCADSFSPAAPAATGVSRPHTALVSSSSTFHAFPRIHKSFSPASNASTISATALKPLPPPALAVATGERTIGCTHTSAPSVVRCRQVPYQRTSTLLYLS